jgi:mRNA interferase HigB
MKIVTEKRIAEFAKAHPDAESALNRWLASAKGADWKSFAAIRNSAPSADQVIVASGRHVVIFNIRGNNYRLITAVHYNNARVFVMMFLTHAEYDKEAWKRTL